MSFSWPWALLSLLIIPIVAGVVWLLRRRRRAAVQVTSIALVRAALPARTRWTRLIPTLLLLLGFATLSVGAARPQATGGTYHRASETEQIDDIASTIDLRLTVAKQDVPLAGGFIAVALALLAVGALLTGVRTGRFV